VLNEAPQDEQWGMEVGINAFLTSPVDWSQWGGSSPGHFARFPWAEAGRIAGSQC
jgi:hypothetical protein